MKAWLILVVLVLLASLMAFGCSEKKTPTDPQSATQSFDLKLAANSRPNPVTYDIWDSQLNSIGHVSVTNDANFTYVTFTTTGNWMLANTQVHFANGIGQIPRMHKMIPDPPSFDYRTVHNPIVQTFMYSISRNDYNFLVAEKMLVAAHCEVVMGDYPNGTYQTDMGWAGDRMGPGTSFWRYFLYEFEPASPNPPDSLAFESGSAMVRMHDDPMDFTFRWGRHPWFTYVKVTPDSLPQTFYLYAEKFSKAGDVMVWADNDSLFVGIDLLPGIVMTASQLNIKLTGFEGAPAFGRFPWKATNDPALNSFMYKVHWNPAWNNAELNLALHADVHMLIP